MGNCLSGAGAVHEPRLLTKDKSARANIMRSRYNTNIDDFYTADKTIGEGSIGTVARAKHKETGKWYALKTIRVSRLTRAMVDELMNEVDILMGLDHPNIVRPLELYVKKREIYLVLPLCGGGDLYTRSPYCEADAARYTAQMVDAVAYMHSFGVVHRDLKFENVLFASRAPAAEVLVIDFGLAKANYAAKRKLDDFVGTLYSMAPEVLRGEYDSKCDVWSLGVVTYMLLAGAMPFTPTSDEAALLRAMEAEKFDMRKRAMAARSKQAKAFIVALLVADAERRPNMQQVQQLDWIRTVAREVDELLASSRAATTASTPPADLQQLTPQRSPSGGLEPADIGRSLCSYANSSRLRKMALMVVAHRSDSDAIRELRAAFRRVDTGREGFITFVELSTLLKGCAFEEEVIAQIFDAVDHDSTGKISYTEFLAACMEGTTVIQEDAFAEAFDRLDADDSGQITRANLREVLGSQFSPELVDEMIHDADFKGTGAINFEDFMVLMRAKRPARISRLAVDTSPPSSANSLASLHDDEAPPTTPPATPGRVAAS
ncbi:kinase-like domain-containing protein [Pelagophyceae sp. CCMP2097]|nr:kinase-like domain-containing protein [Pelagophyceae sp. CCMP2097]|mmetsp:Transcript_9850/g.32481  ORF Transcript_9850/g.32481 Transcript_9850/m.32481 type:complete len:547 (+) Transcript_9850:31-1671(+)